MRRPPPHLYPGPHSSVVGCRAQLARHRPAFTKLSPFNAGIGLRADGRVGLQSSTDNVTNIASCAAAIHGTIGFPRSSSRQFSRTRSRHSFFSSDPSLRIRPACRSSAPPFHFRPRRFAFTAR